MKKLFGNEPTTVENFCQNKKRNESHRSTDEDRFISNNNNDEEETHLLMAQETESERHTFGSDHAYQSYWQDVFGRDSEIDEEYEAKVDLEGEQASALDELKRVRNEYKLLKNASIV